MIKRCATIEKNKRKAVTMDDIAHVIGVSKNTVSLVLSNKPGVSDAMRVRVIETAQQMGYYLPNDSTGKKSCIVVVVPEYIRDDGSFYSDIFWAVEHETRNLGYLMLAIGLSQAAEQNLILPSVTEELEVVGYLAIGIICDAYLRSLQNTGKQVVCVDIQNSAVPLTSVGSDNLYGSYLATQHLIESGHRRIGFAGPVFSAYSVFERWCGYQKALMLAGIPTPQELCILGRRDGFELLDNAATLDVYLSKLPDMPTAWFCAGDMIAVSMIHLLTSRGLTVPGDISVVGFDDLKIAEIITPSLTTIHIDRKMIGKQAVRQLLNQAKTKNFGTNGALHLSLPCSLVRRKSVASI